MKKKKKPQPWSRGREFPKPFTPHHGSGRREKLVPKQSNLLSQALFSARYTDLVFHPPTHWIFGNTRNRVVIETPVPGGYQSFKQTTGLSHSRRN